MRRSLFVALGILEILSAGVLFAFVWLLPGPTDLRDKVGRIERVSRQTGTQVRELRDEVRGLRRSQPHAKQLAEDLRVRLVQLGDNLKNPQLNYSTIRSIHDAFGEVAMGLDGMADRLAPDGFTNFAALMGATADVLNNAGAPDASRFLKMGQARMDRTATRWPEARDSLRGSAKLLRGTQEQLKAILDSQSFYEESLRQSSRIVEGLAAAVPMYTEQWGKDLAEQERSLTTLGASIDEVTLVMPEVKLLGGRLLVMTRLLLGLLGAIFLLHGGYLAINSWLRSVSVPI